MKVERALALLPDLEVLAPLKARILAASTPDDRAVWASAGPYLTVGRRDVSPAELRRRGASAFGRIAEHLQALYDAYVDALDCLDHDDPGGAVSAFLLAARREEGAGRLKQAAAWLRVALELAQSLPDRRPEVQVLLALGRIAAGLDHYEDGARHFQRALVLAEAEFDQSGAFAASLSLGRTALARGELAGTHAWYAKALRLAQATGDARSLGQVAHAQGELALRHGDADAAATQLADARERFQTLGDARELAAVLVTLGQAEAARGQQAAATGAYREALAWSRRSDRDPTFQVVVRLRLAELHLASGRLLDADEELRRAEQLAIGGNLTALLARTYALLGSLHGLQGDDTGFVFFEQALVLARTPEGASLLEADLYREYGLFKKRLGAAEEAHVYLERARDVYERLGAQNAARQLEDELPRRTA